MSAKKLIKKIRLTACKTQDEMAALLGIKVGSYCNYEAGRRIPIFRVIKILKVLAAKYGVESETEDFLEN